jgi:hypothetical protein
MKTLTLLAALLFLGACGSGDSGASDDRREPTVGTEIAEGYTEQLNRARDVEIQLQNQKRDIDAALEESNQGTRNP